MHIIPPERTSPDPHLTSWSGNGETQTEKVPQDTWPVVVFQKCQRTALQAEGDQVDLSRKQLTTLSWILDPEGVGGTTVSRPGGQMLVLHFGGCVLVCQMWLCKQGALSALSK